MTANLTACGIEMYNAYEEAVLPLLERHGARLERRLCTADRLREVHLVWFPNRQAFERYRSDPDRARYGHLLQASGAVIELAEMSDWRKA
ncbi:hypothetical protein GT019_05120 [Paenibacillus sp. T1]|uniref:DUF1330 domain-containing protein n=2 Tax=Paenibacillus glycinis TaxID=2697035 RepID=A0ABW9XKW2_9BACL|nr:hypothetical protein [Paenibacillus glycinis]